MGFWSLRAAAVRPLGSIAVLALCLLATARAQTESAPEPDAAAPLVTAPAPDPSAIDEESAIRLEVGDTVAIAVVGMPELETIARVAEDGRVEVPLVGQIPVLGVSLSTAGERVATAYREGEFLVDPDVRVALAVPRPLPIQVLGEVVRPGAIRFVAPMSVADAIRQAGGTTSSAHETAVILRGAGAVRPATRIEVDLGASGLSAAGSSTMLIAGDQLEVPPAPRFVVRGAVREAGNFPLRRGTTVAVAIETAGGLDDKGSLRRIEILRRGASGLTEVREAQPSDVVQPNDEINVKERWF